MKPHSQFCCVSEYYNEDFELKLVFLASDMPW